MQMLRRIATTALWAIAAVGVACGLVWGATVAGVIKPLIVISGSMEPVITTGDLLIATKAPVADLGVGDVVSLPSERTSQHVTHRIVEIEPSGEWALLTMRGDADEFEDARDYHVTGEVWVPRAQIPGAGTVIARITSPAVAVPSLVALVALLAVTWLIPARVPPLRDPKGVGVRTAEASS